MHNIQKIIENIRDEKCVLIIGPDLVDFGEKQFFGVLCDAMGQDDDLAQMIDFSPQFVFAHEELLQLTGQAIPSDIIEFIDKYYKKLSQFDEPLQKISEIPFQLIISFMPDHRLKNIFESQNLPFQYAYHSKESKNNNLNLAQPTSKQPLIYNLLGDLNANDIILTFEDLFSYLSNTIGGDDNQGRFPNQLQLKLKEARNFVFLGVHFEKWYFQLLLRIITHDNRSKKKKYTLLKNASNDTVCNVVATRLELSLDYIETNPVDFLNQLYEECSTQNLLKKVTQAKKYRPNAKKVFISYSHQDKPLIAPVVEQLQKEEQIAVFVDDEAMPVGERIKNYMQRVTEMDRVIVFVSGNSLNSAYVGKEISLSVERGIDIIPCYLDKTFIEKTIGSEIKRRIIDELDEIRLLTARRKASDPFDDCADLAQNELLWQEYGKNLSGILENLQSRKGLSIDDSGFYTILKQHILS